MKPTDLMACSAAQMVSLLDAGEVSSVELTQAALARIDERDGEINAVCVRDDERALAAARDADRERAGGRRGPLLGVPMTVKESFNVAGWPTTWGMPAFRDHVPEEDALPVARLKAAGAVILGKTNVPFALADYQSYNAVYGVTVNPVDPTRTPGGSSGGSAAALACGYGALSLGSDIGGSLRIPAHCCGVHAHKPTWNLLPSRGHVPPRVPANPSDPDLAVIGPMARHAIDLLPVLDVLSLPDPRGMGRGFGRPTLLPAPERLDGLRLLVLDEHPLLPTAASVRTAIEQMSSHLSRSGAKVSRHSALLPDLAQSARLYMRLLFAVFGSRWPEPVYQQARQQAAAIDPDDRSLSAERARGAVLSQRAWMHANDQRVGLRQRWDAFFQDFDALLCPVMPVPAFPHDRSEPSWQRRLQIDAANVDYGDLMIWSGLATVPGLPATATPIGHAPDGLPIGIQIIGPLYGDLRTIGIATLMERKFGR